MASQTAMLKVFVVNALCLQVLLIPAEVVGAYYSGEGTYYGPYYIPSKCYGYDTRPIPLSNLIAAASSSLSDNGAACGASYCVLCTGASDGGFNPCSETPTVIVTVVEYCPGCVEPGLALSHEAFSRIANPADADSITVDFFMCDGF